jgi:hypothetical protein
MIAEPIVWVVLTGMPKCAVTASVLAAAVSAANPWYVSRCVTPMPSVLIMRQPPASVLIPIVVAASAITQVGT